MVQNKDAAKKSETLPAGVPEGYKSTRKEGEGDRFEIVRLLEGQYLEGHYYGTKILPSKYSADGSVLWMIKCADGEIRLINEKATMKDVRLEHLREGQAVCIYNKGMAQGKRSMYSDIEVYIKE